MRIKTDFYKGKYFWLGLFGSSFITSVPWDNVCTIKGIFLLILVVIGVVSLIGSIFNFSSYFS